MSSDGHGGIWMTVSTGTGYAYYHDSHGHWTHDAAPKFINATVVPDSLARVPGTRREWSGGTELLTGASFGVILGYSK